MPGHQGNCEFLNNSISAKMDITEIKDADFLFKPEGIIENLEKLIEAEFNSTACISTSGSTLLIQTMVSLFKNFHFIASINSHISFFNSCALLNINPTWFGKIGERKINLNELEKKLLKLKKPSVVFITSPNYYGEIEPIELIAKLCKKNDAILMVDNAHGAHLMHSASSAHPIKLGASICCDSWHKTLPTLTGAAVLHAKPNLIEKKLIKKEMLYFASTSPSYLILNSICLCANWLKKEGKQAFLKLEEKKQQLINETKIPILKTDCCKLTIDCTRTKLNGLDVAKLLRKNLIEPEFASKDHVILILSPFISKENWLKLKNVLSLIEISTEPKKSSINVRTPNFKLTLNEAFNKPFVSKKTKDCLNEICKFNLFGEPPGTLSLISGEEISSEIINSLIENCIDSIDVVSNN